MKDSKTFGFTTSILHSDRQKAIEQGMRTLRQDGWLKVAQGLTTIGEVLRVIA